MALLQHVHGVHYTSVHCNPEPAAMPACYAGLLCWPAMLACCAGLLCWPAMLACYAGLLCRPAMLACYAGLLCWPAMLAYMIRRCPLHLHAHMVAMQPFHSPLCSRDEDRGPVRHPLAGHHPDPGPGPADPGLRLVPRKGPG